MRRHLLFPALVSILLACSDDPTSPTVLDATRLTGDWTGTYTCLQGLTGLTLSMTGSADGTVFATFSFYAVPSNAGVPSGRYRMSGTYVATTEPTLGGRPVGRLILSADESDWMRQPQGYVTVDLDGTAALDLLNYHGTVVGPGCSTFALNRVP